MVKDTPRSPRAARSDPGAASAGTAPAADVAPGGVTGPAVPPAGPGPVDPAVAGPVDAGGVPTIEDQPAAPATDTSAIAIEAAAVIAETRPQEAAQVIGAAAGSATEAPSLGTGALADVAAGSLGETLREHRATNATVAARVLGTGALPDPAAGSLGGAAIPTETVVGTAAGVPPGRYSAAGAHGGAPELPASFGGDALLAGVKHAAPRPDTGMGLEAYRRVGFDLEITSRQLNFRRAGVVHPIAPTLRRSVDFAFAELALLRAEPLLVVRDL